MKLPASNITIERSQDFDEKFFSIGDDNKGIIFDLLRSKIYSNPIQAICREISCNARDAVREAGKPDQPIQISLPNTLEPYLKIKDQGVGISPDRIENVFIKFGASTKRSDNKQTGGWGLGAKVPMSYSDSFAIETIYNGTKYNYSAIIDETRVGKLITLSTSKSNEVNGTEISIPIKSADFKTFKDNVEYVCRHWKTKPLIKNDTISYKTPKPSLSGKNWMLCSDHNENIRLIIDQIEYPLDTKELKSDKADKLLGSLNGSLYLSFETGDISLSANRENIHLDKMTREKVSARIDEVMDDLAKTIQAEIDKQPDLYQANLYLHTKAYSSFYNTTNTNLLTKKIKFKGVELSNTSSYQLNDLAQCIVFDRLRYGYNTHYSNQTVQNISVGYPRASFGFTSNSQIVLADTEIVSVQVKHVAQLFLDNKDIRYALVIIPNKGKTWEEINKKHHLDLMGGVLLSSIKEYQEKPAKAPKVVPVKNPALIIYKFNEKSKKFSKSSQKAMKADTNSKIFMELERDPNCWGRPSLNGLFKPKNCPTVQQVMSNVNIRNILIQCPNYSIYGVQKSIPLKRRGDLFKNFLSITDVYNKVLIDKSSKISMEEIKYADQNKYGYYDFMCNYSYFDISKVNAISKMIKSKKSLALKAIQLRAHFADLLKNNLEFLYLYKNINGTISNKSIIKWLKANPEKNMELLSKQIRKTYPLLHCIGNVYEPRNQKITADYVNLIDKNNKTKATKPKSIAKPKPAAKPKSSKQ